MNIAPKSTRNGRPSDAAVAIRRKQILNLLLSGCELKAAAAEVGVSFKTAHDAARRIYKMERRWLLPDELATLQSNRSKSAKAA